MKKSILFLLLVLLHTSSVMAQSQADVDNAMRKLYMATVMTSVYYVDSVDMNKLAEDAINGMLDKLDPHSSYTNAEETRKFQEPLQGSFEGIGVQFNMLEDTLVIIQPVAKGPSEKVGIMAGDRIITVNDTTIAGVKMSREDIMHRLRGPKGSKVKLGIMRQGTEGLSYFTVTRGTIPVNTLEAAYMVTPTIGLIRFTSFGMTTHDEVMKAIEECNPLAPLHNPANIIGIKACQALMPGVPMVAVFDTAFHQTMPPVAYMYALPYEYYEQDKVRRYGFHGTSHKYVSQRAAAMLDTPIEKLKIISCHLGNGSSVTAIDGGKSVDTSMGFTPLAGVLMGTRSGDLDAGIIQYLMERHGYTIEEMLNILNKKSGVQGISGISSDFRDLESAFKEGIERAGLAVDMFNYGVKKLIGSYAAAMGGVDAIVFTAGVGENSASQRMAIASGLQFMGVKMDPEANKVRGKEAVISAPDSKVKVLLIPTNEELMIAMDTMNLVK